MSADTLGKRDCPNCGVEVNTADRFCWNCGSPLPQIKGLAHSSEKLFVIRYVLAANSMLGMIALTLALIFSISGSIPLSNFVKYENLTLILTILAIYSPFAAIYAGLLITLGGASPTPF